MQLFWQVMVWLCTGILVYTYIGYPLFMYIASHFRRGYERLFKSKPNTTHRENDWPLVSFLIPAYNEERMIRKKVENTLDLDYPADKMQIVVVSDGSTDRTNDMLASFGEQEITFIPLPERCGKTTLLNKVIPELTGEIIILSDASGLLQRDALKKVISHFDNPRVGCVSGVYTFDAEDDSLRSTTEKVYWRYETFLKKYESLVHSSIGAHGALYGFRRSLFTPLHKKAINDDFILPMKILDQGYRVLYEPEAVVVEHESTSLNGEFNRRIRINVGNIQQVYFLRNLLHPKYGIIALEFFSHKVLRLISPFCIVMLPVACLMAQGPIYDFLFRLQAVFYLIGALGYIQEFFGFRIRYLYFPFYFIMGNVSAILGFFRFVLGKQSILWKRV